MIKSIKIKSYINNSIVLELTKPEKSGIIITAIDGLGPAKANINTSDVSTNDGGIFNSSRLEIRNVVMHLQFMQTETESIEDIRQKTYKYFPSGKSILLTVETDNNTLETKGYIETNEPDIFSQQESTSISIICPDPLFYTNELNETIFSGVEPMFEFPFENNSLTESLLEIGSIQNRTEQLVYYKGDPEIGMVIYIHALGEASSITIANNRTREKMIINVDKLTSLTGSGIIAGDNITINTQKGSKEITLLRDGKYTNILNCLEKGSKWFTLQKGDNIFSYTSEIGASDLQFYITNKVAYFGV